MRYSKKIRLISFIFSFLVVFFVGISSSLGYEKTLHSEDKLMNEVLVDVQTVSKQISLGFAPNYLSEGGLIAYGFGDCGEYSYLLTKKLLVKGIPTRKVGMSTVNSIKHAITEVYLNGKWYVADPTMGILYKHSFEEIIENPKLADDFLGTPIKSRGSYWGYNFFKDISYCSFSLYDFLSLSMVPNEDIEINMYDNDKLTKLPVESNIIQSNSMINIKWKAGYVPKYISLKVNEDFKINFPEKTINNNAVLESMDSYTFPLDDEMIKDGCIQLKLDFGKKNAATINFSLIAKRSNIEDYAQIKAPIQEYLEITGAPLDIDSINMYINEKLDYSLDVGNPVEEREIYRYLYSNDNLGINPPLNGWGPIKQDADISYRTAEYYADSQFKHSVLIITPTINKVKEAKNCYLNIRYKKQSTSSTPSQINLYDPLAKQYVPIGSVYYAADWTQGIFKIDLNLLKKTLGYWMRNAGYAEVPYRTGELLGGLNVKNLDSIEYDAQGHYVMALLNMYRITKESQYIEKAETILDNLSKNKDLDHDGYTGWGLMTSWDAFSDDSVNDKNTVYTYTTTLIGNAFIEAYRITGKSEYKAIANQIKDTLKERIGYWEDDLYIDFRYSNSENDKSYHVNNINPYVALFFAELDDAEGNNENRYVIEKIFKYLSDNRLEDGNWYYLEGSKLKNENDLLHWAFFGTAFYRAYEITKEENFLEFAQDVENAIINKHVNKDNTIIDNSSIKWGFAELLVLMQRSSTYNNDNTMEELFAVANGKNTKDWLEDLVKSKVDLDNHRVRSWYAYALSYIALNNGIENN